MINLNFNMAMPWRSDNVWDILWNISRSVTKHKAIEFNGHRTGRFINVEFALRFRGDHAGARVALGLFGYEVELHFYDMRHWDYDSHTWECYK
jgi:hypothetical protein